MGRRADLGGSQLAADADRGDREGRHEQAAGGGAVGHFRLGVLGCREAQAEGVTFDVVTDGQDHVDRGAPGGVTADIERIGGRDLNGHATRRRVAEPPAERLGRRRVERLGDGDPAWIEFELVGGFLDGQKMAVAPSPFRASMI